MSDAAKAVLYAGLIATVILLVPIALLAAGVIEVPVLFGIQAGMLAIVYLLAVVLKNRREGDT